MAAAIDDVHLGLRQQSRPLQEFMIVPRAVASFSEALRMASETFQQLKLTPEAKGLFGWVWETKAASPPIFLRLKMR